MQHDHTTHPTLREVSFDMVTIAHSPRKKAAFISGYNGETAIRQVDIDSISDLWSASIKASLQAVQATANGSNLPYHVFEHDGRIYASYAEGRDNVVCVSLVNISHPASGQHNLAANMIAMLSRSRTEIELAFNLPRGKLH